MSVAVAVFAKAPIEGFAKTRLIPRLGARGAADLQRRLTERTVETALESGIGPVSLWCAPDRSHPSFADLAARCRLELFDQCGPDLGARMLEAFRELTSRGPLLVIGTDCPVLDAPYLLACAARLRAGDDLVALPAQDGGYALIGARRPVPELFADMPWGSDAVMAETRARAARLGLTVSEPALVWDIDRPEDYDRAVSLGLLDEGRPMTGDGRL